MRNYSNYTLEHDVDACLKCGACAERCLMRAITTDAFGTKSGLISREQEMSTLPR